MKSLLIIALIGCKADVADTQDTAVAIMNVNSEFVYVNDNVEDESTDEELEDVVIIKPSPIFVIDGPGGFTSCTLLDYTSDVHNN